MLPVPDFLQPLQVLTRPFPRAAVEAAIERREESVPHLLQSLEWVVQNPEEADDVQPAYMLHIFALYLLAQFRETRAFPWILQLFRLPQYESLTGAVATEALAQILASTCGGDIAPLQALIEDRTADQWVRGAAVEALAVLAGRGLLPREQITRYYDHLFLGGLERRPNNAWDNLIVACTDLRLVEHLGAIRTLYRQGIADPFHVGLDEVEGEIGLPPDHAQNELRHHRLIDDTIREIGSWHYFQPGVDAEDAPASPEDGGWPAGLEDDPPISERLDEEYGAPRLTPLRAAPKVGRNDPCPCSSGLKHKKCCGQAR